MKCKKIILTFFTFSVCCSLFAFGKKDASETKTPESTELRDLFFSVLAYDSTGIEINDQVTKYAGVSKYPMEVLLHAIWTIEHQGPLYIIEDVVPEYTGRIDSLFCADDLKTATDYAWVDETINEYEALAAGEKLEALEMTSPTEVTETTQETASNDSDENEQAADESPSERRYRDSEDRLRLFSYGVEKFSVSQLKDFVLVTSDGKKIVRKFYDEMMRMMKKETWTIGTTAAASKKVRTDEFFYDGENLKPFSSIARMSDTSIESFYDEKGLLVSRKKYSIDDKQNKKIDSTDSWKYNSDGKIVEEEYSQIEYDEKRTTKQTGTFTRKETYDYVVKDRTPDYYYYENSVLKMKTIYSNEDSYTTTLYFGKNFSVVAEYEHGRKIKETYLNGEKVERTRTYDK